MQRYLLSIHFQTDLLSGAYLIWQCTLAIKVGMHIFLVFAPEHIYQRLQKPEVPRYFLDLQLYALQNASFPSASKHVDSLFSKSQAMNKRRNLFCYVDTDVSAGFFQVSMDIKYSILGIKKLEIQKQVLCNIRVCSQFFMALHFCIEHGS